MHSVLYSTFMWYFYERIEDAFAWSLNRWVRVVVGRHYLCVRFSEVFKSWNTPVVVMMNSVCFGALKSVMKA